MSPGPKFRPLITSLAFNDQNIFLPFSYNFTIDQILQIKKYFPKYLYKIHALDSQNCSEITQPEQQALNKAKLKIKAVKGIFIETQKPVEFIPKQQVTVLEWYNKSIDLQIPYSSKISQAILEQQFSMYISYYLQNFIFFKNTLKEQLFKDQVDEPVKLTTEQIANQTDIVLSLWNIDPEPSDDKIKVIRTNAPIILCLNKRESYDLIRLKQIIKTDIMGSLGTMMKNNYNTRVMTVGTREKQFICLNSYALEQNAAQEEEKLSKIIGQQRLVHVETELTKIAAKKDHLFLFVILAILVIIYFGLKIFPIHSRNEPQYTKPNSKLKEPGLNINSTIEEQQIF